MFKATCFKPGLILGACLAASLSLAVMAQSKTPKQTYLEYQEVVAHSSDFEEGQAFHTEATRTHSDKKLSPETFAAIKEMLPKNVRILSETVSGDTATLKADGTMSTKMFQPITTALATAFQPLSKTPIKPMPLHTHATGTITMLKENGEWKISSDKWVGDDPNAPAPGSPKAIAAAAVGDFCGQARSMPYPNKPVYGKLLNVPVAFGDVTAVQTNIIPAKTKRVDLKFKKDSEFTATYANIEFNQDLASLVGKTIIVTPSTPFDFSLPSVSTGVNFGTPTAPNLKTNVYQATKTAHYGMRITFSAMRGNMLPGYVVLHLPDPEHSLVEGYFYAKTSTVDAH